MNAGQSSTPLPDAAWLLALSTLTRMGPRRLGALLERRTPAQAWAIVRADRAATLPELVAVLGNEASTLPTAWAGEARLRDPAEFWDLHLKAGIRSTTPDEADHPEVFDDDPEPPRVLCSIGDRMVLDGPRVAIVGTRRCTSTGRGIAHEMGRDLALAGVRVVSGLALGIDAAAHRGALSVEGAPPIGIVGNGLDVVYPRRHADLYREVAEAGVLLSEYPLGALPRGWTFPARNRLVAALADLVVVVESHAKGGSLYTADEALERGRRVLVVPGSVRSPASAGTNQLLVDGCCDPARDADDVLSALGLEAARHTRGKDPRRPPESSDATVLGEVGWEPTPLEQIVLRTGMGLAQVHESLERLEDAGWLRITGGWVERLTVAEASC